MASVALLGKADSAYLDFGIADTTGKYLFKNINRAQAGFISASVVGYEDKKLALAIPATLPKNRLVDTSIELLLAEKVVALQDVVITGTPPIKMNKDTMEFNADYFKTQPNAVLEDLLRKLPGVEVRNGTEVYVNGQRVSKILVDGKEFFSDDPVMILKNLPVEIISKIQVADEKNTVAKETRQQNEIPKTINLKLKKDFRKGAFGKFFAGYGTDNRYESGGLLNVFRDTLQVSFIGSSNNQSRGNSYLRDNGSAFGGSLGGYGSGITTSNLAGINLSYTLPKGIQVNGQYTYGQNRRLSGSENLSKQLLGDSALLTNGNSNETAHDASHKAGFRLKWKQDSTGYLNVNANAIWSNNQQQRTAGSTIYSQSVPLLSQSLNESLSNSNRNTITANVNYAKTFVRQNLDWNINSSFSNAGAEQVTATNTRYIRLSNGLMPDSVIQQRENNTPNRQLNVGTSLNKNWKDAHTISWQADYSNLRDVSGGNTYQFFETSGKNELVPGLSVKLTQHKQRLNNQLSYRFGHKDFSIQPGIAFRTLHLQNSYNFDTIPVLSRNYNLVAPQFSINFKGISFSYNRNLQEPSAYALRPVTDSSNPLYVTSGNPNLRPSKSSNYSLNYYHYFNRPRININVWTAANQQTDAVGTSRQVFRDGKTVLSYVNLKRITSYNGGVGFSKSYHKKDWDYTARLDNYLYISRSPLLLNGRIIGTTATNLNPAVELGVNYKNKYRLQTNYRVDINSTRSDEATVQIANTIQHTLSGTLNLQFTKRFSWTANANYNISPNTTPGFRKQWLFCDMAVYYSLLKKERGQVKLSGYDIFNQNQGIYQSAYLNNITYGRSLVQRQFFMLSFIYTVRKV